MTPPIPAAELAAVLAKLNPPTVDTAIAALADAGLQPEPLCKRCGKLLAMRDSDLGTHAGCDDPVPVTEQPPPTLDVLSAALVAYDRNTARSRQVAVGPSELGHGCDRKLGYSLRGVPGRPGDGVKYAALLGTGFHAVIADAMKAANAAAGRERFLVEQRVSPSPEVSGSVDMFDVDTGCVTDWKVVGESTVTKARRQGPTEQYIVQAHLYGRGLQRLGHDVRWIRIVYLPRWSATITDTFEYTAPYSRLIAETALDRLSRIGEQLNALDVDTHPQRWADVPATTVSGDCFFCNHRRTSAAPADRDGCPGVRSESDRFVDDYVSSLPTEPAP